MHVTFLLEEHLVNRLRRKAESTGKTVEDFLMEEVRRLAESVEEAHKPADDDSSRTPPAVTFRRTLREEIYRLD